MNYSAPVSKNVIISSKIETLDQAKSDYCNFREEYSISWTATVRPLFVINQVVINSCKGHLLNFLIINTTNL